jgi:hypothetical protein
VADDKLGDGDAETLRGFRRRVLLQPVRIVAPIRDDQDLLGGKDPQSVLDRLHGVAVADLRFDSRSLRLRSPLGLAGDLRGLVTSFVLVVGEPSQRRDVRRGRDDPDLRFGTSVVTQTLAELGLFHRRRRHDQQSLGTHIRPIPERGRKENGERAETRCMRHHLRAFLAVAIVALTAAAPSGAIIDGTPDTEHPYVGILVTVIDGDTVPVCSGFLVSSTVFVTAAHCIEDLGGTLPAYVSFDRTFDDSSPVVHGTAVPNPNFGSRGDDIAAVLLDSRVTGRGHATLPEEGLLEDTARGAALTLVGYGADGFERGVPQFDLVRRMTDARLVKLERGKYALNLRISKGICFGDSGGPVLLGDSDVVVGINSFVNGSKCAGNAYAFRTDTPEALDFLADL